MKTLLKLIIGLVIFVLILIFGFLFIISGVNNTPTNLYTNDAINSNLFKDMLALELDTLDEDSALNFHFSEEDVNILLFNFIRSNINESYNPLSYEADNEKYIYSYKLDDNISIIGGKSINFYGCYSIIENDSIKLELPVDLCGIVDSKVSLDLTLKSNDEEFIFHINSLKLGRINLFGDLASKITSLIDLDAISKDAFYSVDLENKEIVISKEKLRLYVINSIESESVSSDQSADFSSAMLSDLISILLKPEYHVMSMNISDSTLMLDFDLSILSVDEEDIIIDSSLTKEFDSDKFITSKTQGMLLNSLSSSGNVINISYNELNQLIYNNTNGYENLNYSIPINDTSSFDINVCYILLNSKDDEFNNTVYIDLIVNLNGIYTDISIPCLVSNSDELTIVLSISNTLHIGEVVEVSSGFIEIILNNTLTSIEGFAYNNEDKSFTINSSTFTSMLNNGNTSSNFEINALNLGSTGLSVSIGLTDSTLEESIDSLTNSFKNLLENDFVSLDDFDLTDDAEDVQTTLDVLDDISSSLTNDETISKETTDKLIDSINNLTDENQDILYDSIINGLSEDEKNKLESLYNDLFN